MQGSWKLGWTPFVEENYGSNPVLRRIFSLARKHGYRSLVIDEITESDCALLVQENKALAARRPDFLRSEVHRIAYFKSPQGHQPGPSDFVGYVVFKRDYFSTQAQPRVHVFESVTPPFRQGPVAGQQYLSELAPTGGEKLWGAGLNLPK